MVTSSSFATSAVLQKTTWDAERSFDAIAILARAPYYLLTNPGPNTPVVQIMQGTTVKFESPVHDYNAVEFTANRRFADRWALAASYRWSRLTGNFEGFFRNDNGQSDPGISSLYDYPTDDPTYTLVGVPVFGYSGDIRFLGSKGDGPLPLDRTHDVKAYGTYLFDFGLSLSAGVEVESGAPLTALAAHPIMWLLLGRSTPDVVAAATIPVERINGPVLLLTGELDGGAAFHRIAADRLAAHGRPHEHVVFPGAGHLIAAPPYAPTTLTVLPIAGVTFDYGGDPGSTARARADAWRRTREFLAAL